MPPPIVNTIREEIYYEYAKLISRAAYHMTAAEQYSESLWAYIVKNC